MIFINKQTYRKETYDIQRSSKSRGILEDKISVDPEISLGSR